MSVEDRGLDGEPGEPTAKVVRWKTRIGFL